METETKEIYLQCKEDYIQIKCEYKQVKPQEFKIERNIKRNKKPIGNGNYGEVYKAIDVDDKQSPLKIYAIKYFKEAGSYSYSKESFILNQIKTKNISNNLYFPIYYGAGHNKRIDKYAIITEYIHGINLSEITNPRIKKVINDKVLLSIIIQIYEAIKLLHENGIAHGDLKPDNIMITKDYKIKIVDFGSSCMLNCDKHNCSPEYFDFTPYYVHPYLAAINTKFNEDFSDEFFIKLNANIENLKKMSFF